MIIEDGVHGAEEGEVVFVGGVVSVPGDDVEGGVILVGLKQVSSKLGDDLEGGLEILKRSDGCEKVTRVGESVGTDGAQRGQFKVSIEDLAHVAPGISLDVDRESDTTLDDADLLGLHLQEAKLCLDVERSLLGHDEEISIRVVEGLVLHRSVGRVDVDDRSRLDLGISSSCDGLETLDKVHRLSLGHKRRRMPTELIGDGFGG
mmetsp:Transcript_29560/g.49707  ORF Transcript_29560/g.49707 Transcript_29560/m.49707 type:complete len:204 (-) Transcript_29560:383-994(-)